MQIAFYSGKDCHLCDLAQQLLETSPLFDTLEVNRFDVSSDHQLYHLYGAKIPVLKRLDNNRELGWPFESQQLTDFLS